MSEEKSRSAGKQNGSFLSARFGKSADPHENLRDLIPGGIVHDSGLGKIEDPLEHPHGFSSAGAVDAVSGDSGDGGIVLGNAV